MAERRLYSDLTQISSFLKELVLVEQQQSGWVEKFFDPKTGKGWLKYQVNSEHHGGGQAILMQLPEPSATALIEIALTSEFEDEVMAAAHRLRDNEYHQNQEFKQELISRLRTVAIEKLSDKERNRIKVIISGSALDQHENRREMIEKRLQEIEEDARFFKAIAEEASNILKSVWFHC